MSWYKSYKMEERDFNDERYNVVKVLGQGVFGLVYLVKDTEENNTLKAVKKIKKHASENWEDLTKEVELHSGLSHPCIANHLDSFHGEDFLCIVMEYCDGGDIAGCLETHSRNRTKLPYDQTTKWLIHIISGLRYLHKNKILHRDIKPQNLLLHRGVVKIADFGISRVQLETILSTVQGTPLYMSPEMVLMEGYDDRSDVWSLGCVIFEMVTLKPLFDAPSLFEVFLSVTKVQLKPWPEGECEDLRVIFERIMVRDRQNRPSILDVQLYFDDHFQSYMKQLHKTIRKKKADKTRRENPRDEAPFSSTDAVTMRRKPADDTGKTLGDDPLTMFRAVITGMIDRKSLMESSGTHSSQSTKIEQEGEQEVGQEGEQEEGQEEGQYPSDTASSMSELARIIYDGWQDNTYQEIQDNTPVNFEQSVTAIVEQYQDLSVTEDTSATLRDLMIEFAASLNEEKEEVEGIIGNDSESENDNSEEETIAKSKINMANLIKFFEQLTVHKSK